MTSLERRNLRLGLLFISPWLLGFLAFTVFPVVASVFFSFCDYDVLSEPVWVGGQNYRDLGADRVFWKSLYNTLTFSLLSLPLGMILALLLAILLNQPVRCRGAFRAIYFLPSLVPMVAGAMVWIWILNGKLGLLNQALCALGMTHPPQWLSDPAWTKPALVLMSLWGVGNSVVIYLASLQDVPQSLYEAAEIDGASAWMRLWHVTIPMISQVIYFNLIMVIIGSLQTFASAYVMFNGGGPDRSALFYAVYLYQNAFEYRQMGYACAMAWILFLLILGLTWLATRATKKHVFYADS